MSGNPPGDPNAPKPSSTTRSKADVETRGKTREELLKGTGATTKIVDTASARAFLLRQDFLIPGELETALGISSMLLRCSVMNNMPRLISETVRAVAIILEDIEVASTSERVADTVLTTLATSFARMIGKGTDMLVGKVDSAVERLARTTEENKQELQEVNETLNTTIEQLLEASKENQHRHDNPLGPTQTQPTAPNHSYAAVAAVSTPPAHAVTMARNIIAARQILIDTDGKVTNGLSGLTERELVAKANEAVSLLDDLEAPDDLKFIAANKLRNGGILFQLTSSDAADWIREHMGDFQGKLGGESSFRPRHYSVGVEFVPVTFDPDTPGALRMVEDANGLERGTLLGARYYKLPSRRRVGQKVAHALFHFSTKEAANHGIRSGLFVEGKRVQGHKHALDPVRCLKCQKLNSGHLAAGCLSIHDTCARCAGMHRTEECAVKEIEAMRCANCGPGSTGHGAADRDCPKFLHAQAEMHARNPENKYVLYPTDDPATWELINQGIGNNDNNATWNEEGEQRGGWAKTTNRGASRGAGRLAGGPAGGQRGSGGAWQIGTGLGVAGGGGGGGTGNLRVGVGGRGGGGGRGKGRGAIVGPHGGRLDDGLTQPSIGDAWAAQTKADQEKGEQEAGELNQDAEEEAAGHVGGTAAGASRMTRYSWSQEMEGAPTTTPVRSVDGRDV